MTVSHFTVSTKSEISSKNNLISLFLKHNLLKIPDDTEMIMYKQYVILDI